MNADAHDTPSLMTAPLESTALLDHPELAAYRDALAAWLSDTEADDSSLRLAGVALCQLALTHAVTAEQLLITVRGGQQPMPIIEGTHREARLSQRRAQRRTLAVNALLECYFA